MVEDSIFTKIIRGDIPSHKVHEDDKTFVFMDIHPIQIGQVLVVPKQQVAFVWDLSDADYRALMETAKRVALRLRDSFPEKSHIGMMIEGLEVAHAHLKLFPFSTGEEYRHKPDIAVEPNHAELAQIAKQLAF